MKEVTKNDYIDALLEILAKESNNHCHGDKLIPIPAIRAFLEEEKNKKGIDKQA